MYTVKQAADIMDISVHTLRFYANNNLFPFIQRNYNNVRLFSDKDLEWIKLVKCLRETGMPLEDVKKYVDLCVEGDGTVRERYDMLTAQKARAEEQARELRGCIDLLTYKVNYYGECLDKQTKDRCNPATGSLPVEKPDRVSAGKRNSRIKSA